MRNDTYEKAKEIEKKLDRFYKFRNILNKGEANRFSLMTKKIWMSDYYRTDEVILFDNEINEILREYCNKKINELREEFKAL